MREKYSEKVPKPQNLAGNPFKNQAKRRGGGGDLKSEGRRVKRGCVVQKCVILNPLSSSLIPLVSKTINQRIDTYTTKGSFTFQISEIPRGISEYVIEAL